MSGGQDMVQIHVYVADLDTLRAKMPGPAVPFASSFSEERSRPKTRRKGKRAPREQTELKVCPVHGVSFRLSCLRCEVTL